MNTVDLQIKHLNELIKCLNVNVALDFMMIVALLKKLEIDDIEEVLQKFRKIAIEDYPAEMVNKTIECFRGAMK